MKKIVSALIAVASFGLSFQVSAAGTLVSGDGLVTTDDCVLLGEQVALRKSSGVSAAYSCTEANTTIKIATCHASGSRKATTYDCVNVGTDTEPVYNVPGCPNAEMKVEVAADYKAFIASTQGGGVAATPLYGNCTDEKIVGVDHFSD